MSLSPFVPTQELYRVFAQAEDGYRYVCHPTYRTRGATYVCGHCQIGVAVRNGASRKKCKKCGAKIIVELFSARLSKNR